MVINVEAILRFIVAVLLFPTLFQESLIAFAWGVDDEPWIMLLKRIALLLPVCAVIGACWLTVPSVLTALFRQKRREFVTALFVTWWDLGKAIVAFWGGIMKFVLVFLWSIVGLGKIIVVGLWSFVQEVFFLPFRVMRNAGQSVISSHVPWVAVTLTVIWCLIEALIFTYVVSPLVLDTLSNVTGEQLSMNLLRIPLFIFLFFVVLGSYAVLSNFVDAVKSKKIASIITITLIELVVMFVEVIFLYREFVDSLVPWFAQYSQGFELGMYWTIAIAALAWFGVRSISWFLFASHGTPTILSVIQGRGTGAAATAEMPGNRAQLVSSEFVKKLKDESEWVKNKGEELLAAFMLPPLEVVAATINFGALLLNGRHLFQLPFKGFYSLLSAKALLSDAVPKQSTNQEVLN
ncbi:MAG: hypothetical protein AB1428_12220 [Bacteroidota bacterium]